VQTAAAYAKAQGDQVNTLLYVMYGLLGFSVLVALIGIVNTLALSIFERTREIGLLRAVGMTRRQLASTIRYEAAIVGLIGTILGLGLGIIFGWLASVAARKTFPVFVMPWTGLVLIAVVGLLCGILAGVLPARRAAKFNVLAAIASE
jgi:putative ABC transport system permease protein